MKSAAGDPSMVVAMVIFFALAGLTVALILIKRIVRKKDVMRGGYVEDDDEN
jgi:hypothetical protein